MLKTSPSRQSIFHPHYIANRFLERSFRRFSGYLCGSVLDLGCGEKPFDEILKNLSIRYYSLDYEVSNLVKPQIRGDAQCLPFQQESFSAVLATEVLEHVPEPKRLLAEVNRVLKPGGHVILSTPQSWPLHNGPYDFYRYTQYGLTYLLESSGFQILELVSHGGMGIMIGQIVNNFLHHAFGGKAEGPPSPGRILHNFCHRTYPLVNAANTYLARWLNRIDRHRLDVLHHSVVARKVKDVQGQS